MVRTLRASIARLLRLTIFSLSLFAACREALGPGNATTAANGLVVTTTSSEERSGLYAFDPVTGKSYAWPTLGDAAVYGGALSANSKTLFLNLRYSGFRSVLTAVDARGGSVLWSLALGTAGQPKTLDGIGLLTGEVMAVAGDDSLLFLWRSVKNSIVGIAALNVKTQRPVAFSGPWNVVSGGIQPTIQRCSASKAILLLVAGRTNASGGPRREEALYLLDAATLAPLDSVSSTTFGGTDIWQVLPSADGRTLYVGSSRLIVRYDMCGRSILASTARRGTGSVAVLATATDTTLLLTDAGFGFDAPGSGFLYLFGRNLELRDSIDVSTPLGGVPNGPFATVTGLAVGGSDGRTFYVRAGSDLRGPLYPAQRARLLIIDVVSRRLVRAIELSGFGLGLLFAPPN